MVKRSTSAERYIAEGSLEQVVPGQHRSWNWPPSTLFQRTECFKEKAARPLWRLTQNILTHLWLSPSTVCPLRKPCYIMFLGKAKSTCSLSRTLGALDRSDNTMPSERKWPQFTTLPMWSSFFATILWYDLHPCHYKQCNFLLVPQTRCCLLTVRSRYLTCQKQFEKHMQNKTSNYLHGKAPKNKNEESGLGNKKYLCSKNILDWQQAYLFSAGMRSYRSLCGTT